MCKIFRAHEIIQQRFKGYFVEGHILELVTGLEPTTT